MAIPYQPGEALTCRQIRELDVLAIEHVGIPGLVLMENAARSAAELIHGWLPDPMSAAVTVLCGRGNNGGDGFVIARHLLNAGVAVRVVGLGALRDYRGDPATNYGVLERMDCAPLNATAPGALDVAGELIARSMWIVDALLGSGADGPPRGEIADLVRQANAARATRIAIDIPSGLNADTGEVYDPCFHAAATITFVAEKVGFSQSAARNVLGRVLVADIGVPRRLIPGRPGAAPLDS